MEEASLLGEVYDRPERARPKRRERLSAIMRLRCAVQGLLDALDEGAEADVLLKAIRKVRDEML